MQEAVTRIRRRWLLGAGYLCLCAGLAAAAFFLEDPSVWWYWALVLVTMPIGPAVVILHLVGGILLFGPEPEGWFVNLAVFLLWMAAAVLQVFAATLVRRSLRRTQSS
jgi:hypothetical protein